MTAKTVWPYYEWRAEAVRRFGQDPAKWAFRCPQCSSRATGADFQEAGHPERLGQECIGRHVDDRGCDWTAYGLIPGPWTVEMPNGDTISCFPFSSGVSDGG